MRAARLLKRLKARLAEHRRRAMESRLRESVAACGDGLRVNGESVIHGASNVRLGNNVNFNGMSIWGAGGVTIGDNFHSAAGCKIFSVNHNYDHGSKIPYDSTVIHKPVTIEDNVWFGYGVMVMPGSVIREGAVIGAGAVVAGTIDKCAVAVGNPARVVKYRDIEHYETLKAQRQFL